MCSPDRRFQSEQFQEVTIYRGWLVAARCVGLDLYQSVVVDPWELEVGNSASSYQTISIALIEGQKWIDEYLSESNGTSRQG